MTLLFQLSNLAYYTSRITVKTLKASESSTVWNYYVYVVLCSEVGGRVRSGGPGAALRQRGLRHGAQHLRRHRRRRHGLHSIYSIF